MMVLLSLSFLTTSDSLGVMTISDEVSPYDVFKHPMGSVHSVFSSHSSTTPTPPTNNFNFNLIVDSGCTRHMFPHKELFISYKETPNSFVILADKSKVSCLGSRTVRLSLQNKSIILHDVLHVPKLRSPLLSVRCFCRLAGCSFIADNIGSYLTFPNFYSTCGRLYRLHHTGKISFLSTSGL
jgi:hypothetical protein